MEIAAKTYFEKTISVMLDDDLVLRYDSKDLDEYMLGIYPSDFCSCENTKYYIFYTDDKKIRDELYNNICYNSSRILKADFSSKENVSMYQYDIEHGYNPIITRQVDIVIDGG